MLKSRHIDKICMGAMLLALCLVLLFIHGESFGLAKASAAPPYVEKLFSKEQVHAINIDIEPETWQAMLANAQEKDYVACDVAIDGERFVQVGLRVKGSNSLTQTAKYGSQRFSLKIEFDHYQSGYRYHGLDKLSLNASFQDNAFMKEVFTYDMMAQMGVPAPLCSYAFVTVNRQDWGLFIATEEIEDAFIRRNYGSSHGLLYEPGYKRLEDGNLDVALVYTDDDFASYDNIFRNAKQDIRDSDKKRLIEALKTLSTGTNLGSAVDIDHMLRYFVVQTFVVNQDSYLGQTGHNYYLYEENGVLAMLPWDYNLAYATYALGGPDKAADNATVFVNWPIDTPAPGEVMTQRPMFHQLMLQNTNFRQYHQLYGQFIECYFDEGYFDREVDRVQNMIAPYVQRDPTRFCSYEDFTLAVHTFKTFCVLRAQSVRGQLSGQIPSTIKGQAEDKTCFVDASGIWIADLGDFDDMAYDP